VLFHLHVARKHFRIQRLDHHATIAQALLVVAFLRLRLRLAIAPGRQVRLVQVEVRDDGSWVALTKARRA